LQGKAKLPARVTFASRREIGELQPVLVLFTRPIPVFYLLQHASSVVGAAIVLVAYVRWLRSVDRGTVAASHAGDRWRYSLLGALAVTASVVAMPVAYFESSRLARVKVASIQTCDGVYLSADRKLLPQLLGRDKPMDGLRIFVGHAGWAPCQLEAEIANGDWTLKRAEPEAIFNSKSEHPWPTSQAPKRST